jgi:hypothetical protein
VISYCYENALSWAYQQADNPLLKEDIEIVLASSKTINFESFLGYFHLWSYVCEKLPLPIPQLERIIPYVLSQWNAIKGGLDTITKLLWLNMYDPPCNTPQSHAIARMLLLGNVIVHRLSHFFTAKMDLSSSYPSLKHFRKAASSRSTFHDTLLQIVNFLKKKDKTSDSSIIGESPSLIITGALTRQNDTRTKTVPWGTLSTGATPQRDVQKWYKTINPTRPEQMLVYQRMMECKGVPVFRVDTKTKSRRGNGSRGLCVECHRSTNMFCIVCKKWLCDPQLAANRSDSEKLATDDPKYITISFDDGKMTEKKKRSVPYFPVGTSPIKLPLKQMELWHGDGFATKIMMMI